MRHHRLIRRKSAVNPKSVVSRQEWYHQSAQVNILMWPKEFGRDLVREEEIEGEEEEEEEEEEEMVPPHVMVARSHVTFSVFEGRGRTLKGRDLRRVRNAVFQQTGLNIYTWGINGQDPEAIKLFFTIKYLLSFLET